MFRPTDYAQKRHNYMPGGAQRRHQAVKQAFTIFTLAVLTCCPGITAIVFNHAKMSNFSKQNSIMDAENIYFVIQGRQYEHIQDEHFLLDSHELLYDHGTKSRLHHHGVSTFFLPAMAGDLRQRAYPHEQYPKLHESKQQE